jgi:ribose 5-phosphate isomerase B
MRIAIAGDHAGFQLKTHLVEYLRKHHEVLDLGVETDAVPSDYPDITASVAQVVMNGEAERGILVCGSGIGACIAANKFPGIYASIAHDLYSAAQGVVHDQMNVLCLGGRVIGTTTAELLCDAFLNAKFDPAERFVRRFEKMQQIEQHYMHVHDDEHDG